LQVEERPPIWRAAADIFNKKSRTDNKGWSSRLGFGRDANNSSPKNWPSYETDTCKSDPDSYFGMTKAMEKEEEIRGKRGMKWIDLAQDKDMWRKFVNAVMKLRVP
jgi:hypothetical protein